MVIWPFYIEWQFAWCDNNNDDDNDDHPNLTRSQPDKNQPKIEIIYQFIFIVTPQPLCD